MQGVAGLDTIWSLGSAVLLLLSVFRLDGSWSTRLRRGALDPHGARSGKYMLGSHRSLELASGKRYVLRGR